MFSSFFLGYDLLIKHKKKFILSLQLYDHIICMIFEIKIFF